MLNIRLVITPLVITPVYFFSFDNEAQVVCNNLEKLMGELHVCERYRMSPFFILSVSSCWDLSILLLLLSIYWIWSLYSNKIGKIPTFLTSFVN